ncbi:hypothetical protein [Bacillus sp. SG-1]|uniref:hypothetical protein n=1 Tax=Bacillus sp. SG-1 TaxID=161544 RepID=UPI0001543F25|nr:hypothetical protein [Bacillus sp. SG-1]EDL66403.1 hypothetical protein BSG1_03585 [Bacillus sp. SG-1]
MRTWWKVLYVAFTMLILFTILQYKYIAWINPGTLDSFYLFGWGISLVVIISLLIFKWRQDISKEDLKQENDRLKEAVEYYRNRVEH